MGGLGDVSFLDEYAYVDLIGRAWKSLGRGDHGMAEQFLNDAVSRQGDLPVAHELLGHIHLQRGDYRAALKSFGGEFRVRRAPGSRVVRALRKSREPMELTPARIHHDIEQLEFLRGAGKLGRSIDPHLNRLREIARAMKRRGLAARQIEVSGEIVGRLAPFLNSALHTYLPGRLRGPAVNPRLDFASIERTYLEGERRVVVIDEFLVPQALHELRRFCMESTFWYQMKHGGYLGAYLNDGFSCGLLFQIASELQSRLPRIYGGAPLRKAWAYKYDSRLDGIPIHADEALVNCNFWLTPDSANRDQTSGGLVVWSAKPPSGWSFSEYNGNLGRITRFVRSAARSKQVIPHRQNRMVVFDSQYFHKTDAIRFREGYENRRINVTLLYGAAERS